LVWRGRFKGKPAKLRRCARNCEAELLRQVRNLPWSVVRFLGRDQPRGVGSAVLKEAAIPL